MFRIDANTLATLTIAATGVVTWLYTQLQARSREQRRELNYRRRLTGAQSRYIFRLENGYNERDLPLPEKPKDLIEIEEAKEEW